LAKGIELAAYIPPSLPARLCGDPGRLRQVLLNLIGNAVKFTAIGEVVVTVSCEAETAADVRLRFEVTDTGIGLAPEAQARLFQPFSQGDASTTRKFGGTGLGLAISRQIVELMGGTIGVRSQPGTGSTFWFVARLGKPAAAQVNVAASSRTLAGVRLLAVDEHATHLRIVRQYAEAWQMRCDTATSAPEALSRAASALAADDPYRVILLDHQVGDVDGVALARTLRNDAAFGRAALLLVTSLDRRFTREQVSEIGASDVLTKPVRQGELQRKLRQVLGGVADSRAVEPSAVAGVRTDSAGAPSLRVIVAEDNLVNQRLIQLQLKKLGFGADLVANGHELLAALAQKPYDLVLMDCQMPELDGYETTRRLRDSGMYPGLSVIAMTANAMEGDREKCLAVGMDDYLSKPTRLEDLRSVLGRIRVAAR